MFNNLLESNFLLLFVKKSHKNVDCPYFIILFYHSLKDIIILQV